MSAIGSVRYRRFHCDECNGIEVYSEWVENILVSDISIHKSKESLHGSVCLYHGVFGNISVFNSTFDLTSSNYDSNGVFVFLSFSSMPENSLPIENSSVTVDHCSFTCRNVLTINLAKGSLLSLNNVNANGSCAGGNKYQGVAAFLIGGANGLLHIINSTFQTFHRAVTVTNVVLVANNTVFSNNSASATKLVDRPHASALSIYGSDSCSLSNVTFTNNGIGDAAYVMPNTSTLLVYHSSITISNCTFLHNMGNALYSYLSDIVFIGFTSFSLNQGYQGAAMNLYICG